MKINRSTNVPKGCKESIIAFYEKPLSQGGLSARIIGRIEKYEKRRAFIGIISNAVISISSIAVVGVAGFSIVSTLQSTGFFEYTNISFVSDSIASGAFVDLCALVIESMPGVAIAIFVASLAFSISSVFGLVRFTKARARLVA
jgi:hypothetical protein